MEKERERTQYKEKLREKKDSEQKMRGSQSNPKRRKEHSCEKMKSGTSERGEREHEFYVISIEIDFH